MQLFLILLQAIAVATPVIFGILFATTVRSAVVVNPVIFDISFSQAVTAVVVAKPAILLSYSAFLTSLLVSKVLTF